MPPPRLCSPGNAALLLALAALPAGAVELRLRFAALERMLAEQVFTEEGKRYLGDRRTRCNFAYLRNPVIGEENGRLRIRARFTGRTSLDVFGRCVGMGDEFDLAILASPVYRDGHIGLARVSAVGVGKSGFYIGRVCAALSSSLEKTFRYPIDREARRLLEETGAQPAYPRRVTGFTVRSISTAPGEVRLELDFTLTIQ